jgi:nicotinate phosphoribosyltransferase
MEWVCGPDMGGLDAAPSPAHNAAPASLVAGPSLSVDLYEHAMCAALWARGLVERPATFSLLVRLLPPNRGYLVAAGLDDALGWLERFHFGRSDLDVLANVARFPDGYLDWLAGRSFTGSVRAVPEGSVVFGAEPILEVDAPMGEAQLAETFLLNQVGVETTLATKAARCRHAAAGRAVVDFALRRAHGIDAGMKLARVARIVGLTATSNIAGAARYQLPASGTMAHSFVQAFADQREAFRAFGEIFGAETILLVDTYDTHVGVDDAIAVASELRRRDIDVRGIRLDSGALGPLAHHARVALDAAGLQDLMIFASGGLDEYEIDRLVTTRAPIDGFGVGTALGTASDAPALDTAYKLVAFDGRPVRKTSTRKATLPGAKQIWRRRDWAGDIITLADEEAPSADHEPLLDVVMRDGRRTSAGHRTLAQIHEQFEHQRASMPAAILDLRRPAAYSVELSARLLETTRMVDEQISARGALRS